MKNEGLNNEQVWKYLTNAIAGNSSYEVVRRLRNEFRDEGLALDLLDTHQQTLDRLKDVYKNALSWFIIGVNQYRHATIIYEYCYNLSSNTEEKW